MEKELFDDYVKNRYIKQMDYYSRASSKNQKRYKLFQWILIILSALTPVLAALNGKEIINKEGNSFVFSSQFIQTLLVSVSSIVAILTTGLKTFNYQELWVNYRTTYEQLKPEFYYYEFNVGPYGASGVDKESLFVMRIESILNKEHSHWPPAKNLQDGSKAKQSQDNNEDNTENTVK